MASDANVGEYRDGSLVDSSIQNLRSRITSGEMAPDDRVPTERVLVNELGVSRTVVREALSSLEALGLIETRGTRGRFVRNPPAADEPVVSEWLQRHSRELFELDEIRSVLESHAIRGMSEWDAISAGHAASQIVRQQGDAIEAGDAVEAARLDRAFHELISSYTQNRPLKELIEHLARESRREMFAVYSIPTASRRSLAQHREIVQALTSSDVERAAELARVHMIDAAREFALSANSDEIDTS
jgi:GntR family transcriptional repressor for pyruvate dehydrogenase complex